MDEYPLRTDITPQIPSFCNLDYKVRVLYKSGRTSLGNVAIFDWKAKPNHEQYIVAYDVIDTGFIK